MQTSYGRASRKESKRRRLKRKLQLSTADDTGSPTSQENGETSIIATPRRLTRAQVQVQEELATPPSATTRAATTPPSENERFLRGRRLPMCTDYGSRRHFAFQGQGFFFCHPCDLWDTRLPDCSMKGSRLSKRFACIAKHKCFSHPTTFRAAHCRKSNFQTYKLNNKPAGAFDSGSESGCLSTPSVSSCSTILKDEELDETVDDDDEAGLVTVSAGVATTNTTTVLPAGVRPLGQATLASETSTVDTPAALKMVLQEKEREISTLKGKILLLQQRIQDMARKNKALTSHNAASGDQGNNDTSKNELFKVQVVAAINDVLKAYPRWSSKRTVPLIAQAVWNVDANQPALVKLARKYFRDTIFTPFNILKEMDLAGGTLSYEGIDILRRVETLGIKHFRGSMIPSKSEIKRLAGTIEWFGASKCPFVLKETSKGEAVEFDYGKAMLCITQAFHLEEIGKMRSLSVASSIDGASLTKNLSMIAGGVKVTDRGARCPLTRQPLLDNPTTMKSQSRNLCIPFKLMMGRETKETFAEFATLFAFFDNLGDVETMPAELIDFMPFRCMTNCDLSAQWKGLCKGGAAKVHTLPCTGCATESDGLATPNTRSCVRWCYEHSLVDPEWMCYHKEMATPEHVDTMKTEVAELLSVLGSALEEIRGESMMTSHDLEVEVPVVASTSNATSIHFLPQNLGETRLFSQLLSTELMIRNLDNRGSMETRRENLRQSMQREATIVKLNREIAHGDVRDGAYFLLMNTMPCVLHMENRNGIKLLTMIFIEGLSNAKKKLLYMDVNAEGVRVSRFVVEVENIVNRSMIGSKDDPCQWMCPFDNKKKEIGPITMDNVRTRKVVDSLDILVAFCVTDQARASLWTTALNNYRTAMILLRKREDFTNAEIASYQSHADKFFQAWVRLWQKEGVTNYIHMMGSGHIADYLYKWKNLYRYSQQGWEAMNSLIKTFFFRRTNHGGGVRGRSKKSRLIPIARWLQRRLVFLCRLTEESIREYADANPMPKAYCTQIMSDDVYE